MKIPAVDIGVCTLCEGCIETCPEVFKINQNTGYLEVLEMENYPVDRVNEAIRDCPEDCISWEDE